MNLHTVHMVNKAIMNAVVNMIKQVNLVNNINFFSMSALSQSQHCQHDLLVLHNWSPWKLVIPTSSTASLT